MCPTVRVDASQSGCRCDRRGAGEVPGPGCQPVGDPGQSSRDMSRTAWTVPGRSASDLGTSHAVSRPPGPPPGLAGSVGPAGLIRQGPPRSSVPQVPSDSRSRDGSRPSDRVAQRTPVRRRSSAASARFLSGRGPARRRSAVGGLPGRARSLRPGQVRRPWQVRGSSWHPASMKRDTSSDARPGVPANRPPNPLGARRPPAARVVRPRQPCRQWIRCRPRSAGSRGIPLRAPGNASASSRARSTTSTTAESPPARDYGREAAGEVLVTGGAGFIGPHVVDALLEAGHAR